MPRWPRPRSQPERQENVPRRQENVPRGKRESGREEQQVEVGRRFRKTVETRQAVSENRREQRQGKGERERAGTVGEETVAERRQAGTEVHPTGRGVRTMSSK